MPSQKEEKTQDPSELEQKQYRKGLCSGDQQRFSVSHSKVQGTFSIAIRHIQRLGSFKR